VHRIGKVFVAVPRPIYVLAYFSSARNSLGCGVEMY